MTIPDLKSHWDAFAVQWREAIGWICAIALAIQFIVIPLVEGFSVFFSKPVKFPTVDIASLITLITTILGLGGLQAYENSKIGN